MTKCYDFVLESSSTFKLEPSQTFLLRPVGQKNSYRIYQWAHVGPRRSPARCPLRITDKHKKRD